MSDRKPDAECVLPKPKGAGLNSRIHWAKRAKDTKSDRSYAKFVGELAAPKKKIRKAIVEVTWRGRGRLPDIDNIIGRCKAFIDGLTDAGWWEDDSDIVLIGAQRERINKGEDPEVIIKAWEAD